MGNPILNDTDNHQMFKDLLDSKKERKRLERQLLKVSFQLRAATIDYNTTLPEDVEWFRNVYLDIQAMHSVMVEKVYNIDQNILGLVKSLKNA